MANGWLVAQLESITEAVRDVSRVTCVRRRACDRSIGRVRSEGPVDSPSLRRFGRIPSSLPMHASRVSRIWPCICACLLHTSNGKYAIPGAHGDLDNIMLESHIFL